MTGAATGGSLKTHRWCVRKNISKLTGKDMCQSLFFSKVVGLRPVTLLRKETLAQVFSCEFCKPTFFSQNTSRGLLLKGK